MLGHCILNGIIKYSILML